MRETESKSAPRILFVANLAKEHINKFHIPTINMLKNEGWEVDVACRLDEDIKANCNTIDLPIDRSPFHTHWIDAYKKLKSVIDKGKYDIVYCHTSVGATLARLASRAARKNGTKVIKFAHGTYFYNNAPWYNWIYYPLYKYLSYLTDAIITITQEDYEFSKKHFSSAEIFLVNGIGYDSTRFNKCVPKDNKELLRASVKIPDNAIVLIYCAELIKNKNQSLLLNALTRVLKKHDNVFLLLVGIDHINGQYQRMSESLGISDNVRFLGWRKDVAELYNASDICVASSIREGFGLNIVEAMQCGLPVIASNNAGHRSIIKDGHNGFIVPVDSPLIFANRIIQLIENPSLRISMANKASNEIDRYSSIEILKEIRNIFYKFYKNNTSVIF